MALDSLIACFKVNPTMVMASAPEDRADCGPVIFTSGIAQTSAELTQVAQSKQKVFQAEFPLPMPLSDPFEPPKVCYDPSTGLASDGTPIVDSCDCNRVCYSSYRGVKRAAADCWEADDISNMCQQYNIPQQEYIMDYIANEHWIRWHENEMLAIMGALVVDNVTNDNSDMVVDVTGEVDPIDRLFSVRTHTCALGSIGCRMADLQGIIMHEDVYLKNLLANEAQCCGQDIFPSETIARSPMLAGQTNMRFTFQGKPVYLSDDKKLVDLTDPLNPIYKTYYFGRGLFQMGRADLNAKGVPSLATDRTECDNGGFGAERIHSRQEYIIHPKGWTNRWNESGTSSSLGMPSAEIGNPVNWDRVMQRKNIPFAAVCSAG